MAKKKTGNTFLSTQTVKSYSSEAKKKKDEVTKKTSSSSNAKKSQVGSTPKSMQKTAETTRANNKKNTEEAVNNLRKKRLENQTNNQVKEQSLNNIKNNKTNAKPSTNKEVTNRLQNRYSGESSFEKSRMDNLTEGAVRQFVGGKLKALSDTANEVDMERDRLASKLERGNITQSQYDSEMANIAKSGKAKMYDTNKQLAESKTGLRGKIMNAGSEVRDWADKTGTQMLDRGNKQIESGKEGLGTLGVLAADAYVSGLGMAGDMIQGPAWMSSMFTRSYGSELGNAEAEGATKWEDRMNAFWQGAKEEASEFIFTGAKVPIAMVGKKGLTDMVFGKALDKVANVAKTQMGRNIMYSTSKRLLGTVEEMSEELVAGLAEPVIRNITYADNIGQHQEFNPDETIEAMLSAGLMTMALGIPGAVQVNANAKQTREIVEKGYGSIENLTDKARKITDPIMSARAEAMYDRVKNGNGLADEQVVELVEALGNESKENIESTFAVKETIKQEMQNNGYVVPPSRYDMEGNVVEGPSNDAYKVAEIRAKHSADKLSLPENESNVAVQSVSEIESGNITPSVLSAFPYQETGARQIYHDVTGEELPVVMKNGKVDIAATNAETKLAIINRVQRNAIELAEKETAYFVDNYSGQAKKVLSNGLGSAGQDVMDDVIDYYGVDGTPEMFKIGLVIDDFYQAGTHNIPYSEVMANGNPLHKEVLEGLRKIAYEAGQADANNVKDQFVKEGEKIGKANKNSRPKGKLIVKKDAKLSSSDRELYKAIAKTLNINIHIGKQYTVKGADIKVETSKGKTKTIKQKANGYYKNREIYLSVEQVGKGLTLDYTFRHELTHHLRTYAPAEYKALEDYVMDEMFKNDPVMYENAINTIIQRYAYAGVKIDEAGAKEEIVADAMRELNMDNSKILRVCNENVTLGQKILEAIRSLLDKIRSIFASNDGYKPEHNQALLEQLDIYKEAERLYLEAIKKAYENRNAWVNKTDEDYAIVEDKGTIDFLENQDHIVTYRAMALIDGELYPPMSVITNVDGERVLRSPELIGKWVQSEINTNPKNFNKKGKFVLIKDNGQVVPASYNPYIHSSLTMLNDQFETAYKRPNLVVVEGIIPVSELESNYRAEHKLDDGTMVKAKDTTGKIQWKAGKVQAKLSGKRTVYLSRWFKPTRVVPVSEVADSIANMMDGEDVAIPDNVITPSLREELIKRGVNVSKSGLVKYSITPEVAEAHREEMLSWAKESYGSEYTSNPMESGYIFPNGKMLRMGMYGTRGDDHSIATMVYDDVDYSTYYSPKAEAQNRFINEGNIRFMPESESLEFGSEIEPTSEQYAWIYDVVESGYVSQIEFASPSGNSLGYKDYGGGANADELINDIKRFYRDGAIGGSQLSQFRYSVAEEEELNDNGVLVLEGGSIARYSLTSLREENADKIRKLLLEHFDEEQVDKWINDINSVASVVESNRPILDYIADRTISSKKKNMGYKYTFDFSTLCPKRTIYQGTLNAIYKEMPDAILWPSELIKLRKMLKDSGYQSPCGFCYVESERKWLDQKVGEFLKQYDGEYKPKPTELTATDSKIKTEHPEAWKAWLKYRGKLGQGGPRLVDPRTDYRGEILRLSQATVDELNAIGGLRFQSYSDFEVYHMLDMFQAIRDASIRGLKVQLYTKIPACAEIFGGTGIKINLSLVAKVDKGGNFVKDKDGKLVFDDEEGMPYKEAERIRNMYPEDVGTILVGHSRQHMIEAFNDDRIDFIIPFHKSGWSMKEYAELGLKGYEDIAMNTNEDGNLDLKTRKKAKEIYSGDYWDYSKTGKENAEIYLQLCKERGVTPSFYSFLDDNGDGSWSLKKDGSTDGYWKVLIDGKMYDNDGVGAKQKPVTPEFNMEAAHKLLKESIDEGGNANDLPVANDVVKQFVEQFNTNTFESDIKYSFAGMNAVGANTTSLAEAKGLSQVGYDAESIRQMTGWFRGADGMWRFEIDNSEMAINTKTANDAVYNGLSKFDIEKLIDHPTLFKAYPQLKSIKISVERNWPYNRLGTFNDRDNILSLNVNLLRNFDYGGYGEFQKTLLHELQHAIQCIEGFARGGNSKHYMQWSGIGKKKGSDMYRRTAGEIEARDVESRYPLGPAERKWTPPDVWDEKDVVFVEDYMPGGKYWPEPYREKFSISPEQDQAYLDAVNNGDMETAQKMVEDAANVSGYTLPVWHGSSIKGITTFNPQSYIDLKTQGWTWVTPNEEYAQGYKGYDGVLYKGFINPSNMLYVGNVEDEAVVYDGTDSSYTDYFIDIANKLGVTPDELFNRVNRDFGGSETFNAIDDFFYPPYEDYEGEEDSIGKFLPMYLFTRSGEFKKLVEELGYDGIETREGYMNVAYGLSTSNQFKSADTVTYREDGNVIPLSERFNPSNPDIRYSLPTTDSDGQVLSNEQMEYFAESKARDEEGRLVKVYHTTNHGGFTVFDPSESDDHRSLFFSSSEAVSRTYAYDGAVDVNDALSATPKKHIIESIVLNDDSGYDGYIYWEIKGKTLKDGEYVEFESFGRDEADEYHDSAFTSLENALTGYTGVGEENVFNVGVIFSNEFLDGENLMEHGLELEYEYDPLAQGVIYPVYLNLENPLIIYGQKSTWSNIWVNYNNPESRSRIISLPDDAYIVIDRAVIEEIYDYDSDEKEEDYEQYRHARITVEGEKKNESGEWERFETSTDSEGEAWDVNEDIFEYVSEDLGIDIEWLYDTAERLSDKNGELLFSDVAVFNDAGMELDEEDYEEDEEGNSPFQLAEGRRMSTRQISKLAKDKGYDGVIIKDIKDYSIESALNGNPVSDIYIAFRPEQIKLVNNKKPTSDPDIRFSVPFVEEINDYYLRHQDEYDDITLQIPYDDMILEESRFRRVNLLNDIKRTAAQRGEQIRRTDQDVLDTRGIKSQVRDIVKSLMAQTGKAKQYDTEMVDEALEAVKSMFTLMRNGNDLDASTIAFDMATKLMEEVSWYDDSRFQYYSELRDYFRKHTIRVGDKVGDEWFRYYGKNNINRMIVARGTSNVEDTWTDMVTYYPELFGPGTRYEDVETEPDMLLAIEEVLDGLEPVKIALESEEACAIATSVADDLLGLATKGEVWLSYADKQKNRYDAMVKKMKVRQKEAVRDAIKKERERADKKFNEYRDKANARLEATRLRGQKALEDYKQSQADARAKRAELKERAKYYGHVVDNYEALCKMLMNPDTTKMKLVPQEFRRRLAEVLVQLDLQTEKSKALEDKYGISSKTYHQGDLRKALADISKEDNTGIIEHNAYLFDLLDYIDEQIKLSKLRDYDTMDLQKLDDLFASLKAGINNINKAFTLGKAKEISAVAEDVIDAANKRIDTVGARGEYAKGDPRKLIDDVINSSNVTAVDFFEILGGGMYDCYKSLRRGQDKHIENYTYLRNYFSKLFEGYNATSKRGRWKPGSEVENWRKADSATEFTLESGDVITLTPSQVMSLYLLSQREQACSHIYGNGIVVAEPTEVKDIKSLIKKKRVIQGGSSHITRADVERIKDTLTPDQKKMANELQRLLRDEIASWGNETSMQMYGVKLFNEDNYFPIYSEKMYLETTFDQPGEQPERIRNFGFTKGLVKDANNAIVVADIFEVIADHCNKMSLYNAFAAPISDFQRVFNYQVKKDGLVSVDVKHKIGQAYGSKAIGYIKGFMSDLNGTTAMRSDGLESIANQALANYKKAAIGGNIRVLLQQPTAIIRALDVIDAKYFAKGKVGNPVADIKEMQEHCPIAAWKAWGNYQNDFNRSLDDIMMNREWNKWDAITMGIYGVADNVTWAGIWRAVKAEIKDTHPEVAYESDEYWKLCGERASYVFDKTQVVDSVFHRSEAMRKKDFGHKIFTSFMAEPTRTYNMLRTDISKARILIAEGNNEEASKIIARTALVFIGNAAVVSFAAGIADAFRGNGDGDDDKAWIERLLSHWLENFGSNINILNNIVFIKDIYALKDGWGTSNMALEGWEKTIKAINDMFKVAKGESTKTALEVTRDFVEGIGYVTGIPTKNVMRELDTIAKVLGFESFAAEEEVKQENSVRWFDYEGNSLAIKDGSGLDNVLNHFGLNLTEDERTQREWDKTVKEAKNKCKGLTGADLEEKAWNLTMDGYTADIKDGDFTSIYNRRELLAELGGDLDEFDEKVMKQVKSNYKATIGDSSKTQAQQEMLTYMQNNGASPATISELCYKSDTGKKLKAALLAYDRDAIVENLGALKNAGLTLEDFIKLYKNRSSGYDKDYLYQLQGGREDVGYKWPCTGTITDGFGYRNSPVAGASTYHEAIDIGADLGTPVTAMKSGTVVKSGWNGSLGFQVVIDHGDGTVSYYNHLNDYGVLKGDIVTQGQRIASVGSTGLSTGPHLDFRVSVNGTFVDPLTVLNA